MKILPSKFLIVLGVVAMFGVAQAEEDVPDSIPGTTKVSAETLIDLVDEKADLIIIDARKPSDRANGFIEGSIGLTDTDTTPEALAAHVVNKETPVAFYCNGVKCGRSVKSAKIAIDAGYKNIYWFRGGWEEWMEKGYPVSR